jgi:hypothetical protein
MGGQPLALGCAGGALGSLQGFSRSVNTLSVLLPICRVQGTPQDGVWADVKQEEGWDMAVPPDEHCRCVAQGILELQRRLLGGGCRAASNTCFLECEELLFIDTVLLWIKSPRMSENGSCTTCANVVNAAVERLGCCGAGPQQRREFFEQLLNLGRKNGDACL